MDTLRQIDLSTGDINPESGQMEGALLYYVWLAATELVRLWTPLDHHAWEVRDSGPEYSTVILTGRLLSILYSLGAILFVYLSLSTVTARRTTPLLGALILAIYPFEVIYSHFARTHAMGNLFLAAVIYLSFELYRQDSAKRYAAIGLVVGLGFASRWTNGIILLVPFFVSTVVLIHKYDLRLSRIGQLAHHLALTNKFLIVIPTAVLGAFIGNPMLFLKFGTAWHSLHRNVAYTDSAQFGLLKFLDLTKLGPVLGYLIPYGSLPLLWLLCYASVGYTLCSRKHSRQTIPLLLFGAVYLFLMAKGYTANPQFARATYMIFPVFAIVAALAVETFTTTLRNHSWARRVGITGVCAILGSTFVFDLDYVTTMGGVDPRTRLHHFIRRDPEFLGKTLAVVPSGWNYFLLMPALGDLPKYNHDLQVATEAGAWKDAAQADYILLPGFQSSDQGPIEAAKEWLAHSTDFELYHTFDNTPRTLRWAARLSTYPPPDMLYPFPVLYLYENRAPRERRLR